MALNGRASAQVVAVTSAQWLAEKVALTFRRTLRCQALLAARGFSRTANHRPPRWTKPTGSWSVSGHSQEKRKEFKVTARGERARPRSRVSAGLKEPPSARSVSSLGTHLPLRCAVWTRASRALLPAAPGARKGYSA